MAKTKYTKASILKKTLVPTSLICVNVALAKHFTKWSCVKQLWNTTLFMNWISDYFRCNLEISDFRKRFGQELLETLGWETHNWRGHLKSYFAITAKNTMQ